MRRLLIAALAAAPLPAAAQHHMPGMTMPMPAATPAPKRKPAPVRKAAPARKPAPAADPHAGHTMPMPAAEPAPAADPHAGHDMSMPMPMAEPATGTTGTDLPAGNAPPPAPVPATGADRYWNAARMASARAQLRGEHGGMRFDQIFFNIAEVQAGKGAAHYRWDGEGWFGGDVDRLVVKTEGSGAFAGRLDDAEVQALYSRAIGPYFNLQAGVRQDVRPTPATTYAAIGVEGLAPYWFDVAGTLFVSHRGDVSARVQAWYDQRLTQRLILQPWAELNLAAQDVRETGTRAGLSDAELALRLRYEIAREFAPYVGIAWQTTRGDGEPARLRGVAGVRFWF